MTVRKWRMILVRNPVQLGLSLIRDVTPDWDYTLINFLSFVSNDAIWFSSWTHVWIYGRSLESILASFLITENGMSQMCGWSAHWCHYVLFDNRSSFTLLKCCIMKPFLPTALEVVPINCIFNYLDEFRYKPFEKSHFPSFFRSLFL